MLRKFRAGAPLGDVALMKIVALDYKPAPAVKEQLGDLEGYFPKTDMPVLRTLPDGSLGREYARFLDAQGIEPFVFSADIKQRFAKETHAIRYLVTHDLHHMLGGFDAGLAGEAGVLAFTVGQKTFGSVPLLMLQLFLAMLLSPTNMFRLWKNVRRGYKMGKGAKLLIGERIEEQYERPLADVRADYAIPNPHKAGILPSRPSWFAKLFYKQVTPKMMTA